MYARGENLWEEVFSLALPFFKNFIKIRRLPTVRLGSVGS